MKTYERFLVAIIMALVGCAVCGFVYVEFLPLSKMVCEDFHLECTMTFLEKIIFWVIAGFGFGGLGLWCTYLVYPSKKEIELLEVRTTIKKGERNG